MEERQMLCTLKENSEYFIFSQYLRLPCTLQCRCRKRHFKNISDFYLLAVTSNDAHGNINKKKHIQRTRTKHESSLDSELCHALIREFMTTIMLNNLTINYTGQMSPLCNFFPLNSTCHSFMFNKILNSNRFFCKVKFDNPLSL